ncbi:MAG: hypothetical protein ACK2UK_18320 [Candidatus Promineifilaceae bacterium]
MSGTDLPEIAVHVQETAQDFAFPATPDIAAAWRQAGSGPIRRPFPGRWAVGVALGLLVVLLAAASIPSVRAALLDLLRIGAIEIRINEGTESTAVPTLQPLSILDLGQELSPDEAQSQLRRGAPRFPPELGAPNAVFGQNLLYREPILSYVWWPKGSRPQLVLTVIEIPGFAIKWAAGEQVTETNVNGRPAIWIAGPHPFDLDNAQVDQQVTIDSNVLIWSDEDVTYRLEGELTLQEARALATLIE